MPERTTHPPQPDEHLVPELQHSSLRERAVRVADRYHNWSEAHPLAATAAETVALFALKKAIRAAGNKAGVNLGNGHSEKQLAFATKHPVGAAVYTTIVAPVAEELMYRVAAPYAVKKVLDIEPGSTQDHAIDHIGAIGFASTHVGDPRTPAGRENLAIPIGPLIGGEHYRSLLKRRGLPHAIAAHMIHNTLASAEVIPEVIKRRRTRKL